MLVNELKKMTTNCQTLEESVVKVLDNYNKKIILAHTLRTRDLAVNLAKTWGLDTYIVETAALLHDISGIIPNGERVEFALKNGIEVLEEEDDFPLIIHQKISKFLAEEVFEIDNKLILSAIECHTTLKANPTFIDKIIFIADKLEWDRDEKPIYYDDVYGALMNKSLDAGVEEYLQFVYEHRGEYAVIHPWLNDAFDYFNISYEQKDYVRYIRSMVGHRKIILAGASATIINDKNQVLLQKRKADSIGKWGLPGGLMELGESFEENVIREVLEETGLIVKDLEFVDIKSGKQGFISLPNGDEFYVISANFLTRTFEGEPKISDDESLELKFIDIDNLPGEMVGRHRRFVEKAKREKL